MEYYIGLDVSLKAIFIHIVNVNGEKVYEGNVCSEGSVIGEELSRLGYKEGSVIGIESGQLSISLSKDLRRQGFKVICLDARHMSKVLSLKINKNDKNDAKGISLMLRAGVYKEVKIKDDKSCELKVLLGSRRQLVNCRQQLMGTIRGLLKIYGVKIGIGSNKLSSRVEEAIVKLPKIVSSSIEELLLSLSGLESSVKRLDMEISAYSKEDEDVKLLLSIPGVGSVTATTYISSVDDSSRFSKSEDVGAYMGLTPRQYCSGEIDRHGSISKMGPKECRVMLYEAAQSLLFVSKKHSKLKAWGLRLIKKKGSKKGIVAVARKLAVIMHKMLTDRKEFRYA